MFNGFLSVVSYTTETYGSTIKLPIKGHRNSRKWMKKGKLMTSFLVTDKDVHLRWEVKKPKRVDGHKVGADQGMKTVLTISNGQVTPDVCPHGHSLESISKKLSRRKKGSNNFLQAQKHRLNFINYSINQLNFDGVAVVGFEEVKHIRRGNRSSRFMSHWTYTDIRKKVEAVCEELGVQVIPQSSTYRSQRCSGDGCGFVYKRNRKKKEYACSNCGLIIDADLNWE